MSNTAIPVVDLSEGEEQAAQQVQLACTNFGKPGDCLFACGY